VTKYALELLSAERAGRELPAMPEAPPPADEVKNAADYAGTYTSPGGKTLTLAAEGARLVLVHAGRRVALERSGGPDSFIVKHPEFELFRLVFAREDGAVVEAAHGADWYAGARYAGPRSFEHPKEWEGFAGRYRHDSPWYGSTRVVLRKGRLWLDGEQPLEHAGGNTFRTGPEDTSPERVTFEAVTGGRAMRMNFSTVEFKRTFVP
jgi:hypothetical protein